MAKGKNANKVYRNINLGKNTTRAGRNGPGNIFGGLKRGAGRIGISGPRSRKDLTGQ